MKYQKRDGSFGSYPHSFGYKDLDQLEDFLYLGSSTMIDAFLQPELPGTVVRHDVDHNLEHAAKFAKWEYERNLKATYFVLHTAWYYKDTERMSELLHEIVSYGHEVGIHNDAVSQAWAEGHRDPQKLYDRAGRIIYYELTFLRDLGFPVVGTAAHGGLGDLTNLSLWDNLELANLGLKYEAYHQHQTSNYISDNRGEWRAPLVHTSDKPTHLLIHPCHWQLP